MRPLTIDEVLRIDEWERVRPVMRPLFIHEKERRRLTVGPHLTFLFENRQTVWYQVEEMIRVERMTRIESMQHEIETYNHLLPQPGELSATLFIEYTDAAERDAALAELVGIERHLWLRAGDERIAATFEAGQIGADEVSSVQFVRFTLPQTVAAHFDELARGGRLAIEFDHPALTASARIEATLASALVEDLREQMQTA